MALSLQSSNEKNSIRTKCDTCNFVFKTEKDLNDHTAVSKHESQVSNIDLRKRKFNYNLTTHKARSNLVKSANREPFETVYHQKCVKFLINAGLYKIVLLPLISSFENLQQSGPLLTNSLEISLVSMMPGYDLSGKIFKIFTLKL